MKQERKIYDAVFKIKAVELSNNRSNLSGLARELGIKVSLLYKWRKDYQEYGMLWKSKNYRTITGFRISNISTFAKYMKELAERD